VKVSATLRQALENPQGTLGASGSALTAGAGGLGAGTLAPAECRAVLTAGASTVLAAEGWMVTVVEGDADHYTGIEATRGDEHLLAAVGTDDLITDQTGAHDCAATLDAILSGLQAEGAEVAVTNDVPHDGRGGSLYAIDGGPTRAHAIASTLRLRPAVRSAGRHRGAEQMRNSAGGH
jgi:hypothetical protein